MWRRPRLPIWHRGRFVHWNLENPVCLEPLLIVMSQFPAIRLQSLDDFLPKQALHPRLAIKAPIGIETPVSQQLEANDQHQQVSSDVKARKLFEQPDDEAGREPQ